MSEVVRAAEDVVSPFVTTTTPAIEIANRLVGLRSHPGFNDLVRISQELVESAAATLRDYPGWDAQQVVVLKVRYQTAWEHHHLLLSRLTEYITRGVEEARTLAQENLMKARPEDVVEQSDYVRGKTLQWFEEQDQRAAGSY